MSDPTCATPNCGRRLHARGLCKTCYGRLWRAGGIQPMLPLGVHSLSQVDTVAATGVCAICGPVSIRVRPGRGHECRTARKVNRRAPVVRITPDERRRWKYKITAEQFTEMVESQDGRCAICRRADELKVDHDHACCPGSVTCGECVRGLLCDWCNRGLGIFRDDSAALSRAAIYLVGRS